jgi:predicted CXXCH cytochrome family protein
MKRIAWLLALSAASFATQVQAADTEFVGSERCKGCHVKQYETWKSSYHAKMVRKKDEAILKAVVEKWASDGANPGPTKSNVDGKPRSLEDVVFVVGAYWKQRFLVKDEETGGHQFLDKQFNRISGKWEAYGNKNDWETNCGTCHTTGFRVTKYDPAKPQEQAITFAEMSGGCEACHGPGARHVASKKKKDIYSFAGKTVEQRTLVCGYCHIRAENDKFKTAQGNPSEHLPHPTLGQSFKAGDDWRKWYPAELVIPGVHAEDKIDAAYEGDLKGLFRNDDVAKAGGFFDGAKHHQQYQEFLQSSHYKKSVMACNNCHSSHASKAGKVVDAKQTCTNCHDASYTVDKYMPGTGMTVQAVSVRTHTFNKNQTRRTIGNLGSGEPEYANQK